MALCCAARRMARSCFACSCASRCLFLATAAARDIRLVASRCAAVPGSGIFGLGGSPPPAAPPTGSPGAGGGGTGIGCGAEMASPASPTMGTGGGGGGAMGSGGGGWLLLLPFCCWNPTSDPAFTALSCTLFILLPHPHYNKAQITCISQPPFPFISAEQWSKCSKMNNGTDSQTMLLVWVHFLMVIVCALLSFLLPTPHLVPAHSSSPRCPFNGYLSPTTFSASYSSGPFFFLLFFYSSRKRILSTLLILLWYFLCCCCCYCLVSLTLSSLFVIANVFSTWCYDSWRPFLQLIQLTYRTYTQQTLKCLSRKIGRENHIKNYIIERMKKNE